MKESDLHYGEWVLLSRCARGEGGFAMILSNHLDLRRLVEAGLLEMQLFTIDKLTLYKITDAGKALMRWPLNFSIFEAEYGGDPRNFHVVRRDDKIEINLTYPPYGEENPEDRCRYIVVNQESVRASDGIRLSYDYTRDGFVIEQPKSQDEWVETEFVTSWKEYIDEDMRG